MGALTSNLEGNHHGKKIQYFQSIEVFPQENVLKARVIVHNPIDMQNWQHNLSKIRKINSKNLLLPLKHAIVQSNVCGSSLVAEIEYECFDNLLSDQLNIRKEQQKYLQQSQLWYIVFALSQAAYECHVFNSKLGDPKPSNIVMNLAGNIRIFSQFAVPQDIDSYYRVAQRKCSLLAPEELSSKHKMYMQNHHNYVKAESFSIGMTLLTSASLENVFRVYDYQTFQFNFKDLQYILSYLQKMEFFSQKNHCFTTYSHQLKNVIYKMLQIDPNKRLTSLQMYQKLKPYEKDIMQLKPIKIGILEHNEQYFMKMQASLSPVIDKTKTSSNDKNEVIKLKSKKQHKVKDQEKEENLLQKMKEFKQSNYTYTSPMLQQNYVSPSYVIPPFELSSQHQVESRYYAPIEGALPPTNVSDMMKKIEAQLQQSKRQFPSHK